LAAYCRSQAKIIFLIKIKVLQFEYKIAYLDEIKQKHQIEAQNQKITPMLTPK